MTIKYFEQQYSQLFLNGDWPLQDGHLVLVPAVLQSFYCNYYLPIRRTTDTFEIVNGHFWSALCNEKYLKTEMKVPHVTLNSVLWALLYEPSLFTDSLFPLESPSSSGDKIWTARDEIYCPPAQRGSGGGGGRGRDGREENLLALGARSRSPIFSKRTKRKIKQRLCTG